MNDLYPALLDALSAVDRGDVSLTLVGLGQRRVWHVAGRPNTPAVECLIADGLVEEDRECVPPLAVTDKGRALLNTFNQPEGA